MNDLSILDGQHDLEMIREKYGVDKERFVRGVIFAENLVNGMSANESYSLAFEISKYEASTRSANFRNTKWVQDLIKYFKPDQDTLYFGEIRAIIRAGMHIIDDPYAETKDKVAAMNALAKYVKAPPSKSSEEEIIEGAAASIIGGLMEGIAKLSEQDKMINEQGEIVDVPILK